MNIASRIILSFVLVLALSSAQQQLNPSHIYHAYFYYGGTETLTETTFPVNMSWNFGKSETYGQGAVLIFNPSRKQLHTRGVSTAFTAVVNVSWGPVFGGGIPSTTVASTNCSQTEYACNSTNFQNPCWQRRDFYDLRICPCANCLLYNGTSIDPNAQVKLDDINFPLTLSVTPTSFHGWGFISYQLNNITLVLN